MYADLSCGVVSVLQVLKANSSNSLNETRHAIAQSVRAAPVAVVGIGDRALSLAVGGCMYAATYEHCTQALDVYRPDTHPNMQGF
jgi:hypothetical protein